MCRLRPRDLTHFLQIRNRLEIVGVKFARIEREVRLDVVVEFHHLELHAFLLKRRLDEVDDVGVRHGVTPMRSVVSARALPKPDRAMTDTRARVRKVGRDSFGFSGC